MGMAPKLLGTACIDRHICTCLFVYRVCVCVCVVIVKSAHLSLSLSLTLSLSLYIYIYIGCPKKCIHITKPATVAVFTLLKE